MRAIYIVKCHAYVSMASDFICFARNSAPRYVPNSLHFANIVAAFSIRAKWPMNIMDVAMHCVSKSLIYCMRHRCRQPNKFAALNAARQPIHTFVYRLRAAFMDSVPIGAISIERFSVHFFQVCMNILESFVKI